MKPIKVVVLDDDKLGIDSLVWELSRLDHPIEVVKTFLDPTKANDFLKINSIDLLFLDIEMPRLNGFEFLEQVGTVSFKVIFVTAYNNYALKAFEYSALDYLLKPVEPEGLEKSIQKFNTKRNTENPLLSKHLDIYRSIVGGELPEKVVFSTKESFEFIQPTEIIYAKADSNYSTLFLTNEKLVVSKTLKEIELLLAPYGFIRAHRTFLVNPNRIKRLMKSLGGTIIMDNEKEVPISRSRREEVMKMLTKNLA